MCSFTFYRLSLPLYSPVFGSFSLSLPFLHVVSLCPFFIIIIIIMIIIIRVEKKKEKNAARHTVDIYLTAMIACLSTKTLCVMVIP